MFGLKRLMMKRSRILLEFIWVLSLGFAFAGCGGDGGITPAPWPIIEITDDIDVPTTWVRGYVYLIRKYDFHVNSTLTIEPQTVIKFHPTEGPYMLLGTGGRIIADASGDAWSIIFTSYYDETFGGDSNGDSVEISPRAGDWGYIGTNGQSNSVFNDCAFYYGGKFINQYDCTLQIYNSSAMVINCRFAHNKGLDCGTLDANRALSGTVIQNNTFYDNQIPLAIDTTFNIDNSNIFSYGSQRNTYNGIFLLYPNDITTNISWGETEVAFVVQFSFYVNSGASLSLGNNVTVKFGTGNPLDPLVTLTHYNNITKGTGVVFTSFKDDSRKGDTNGNGEASIGENGDWDGIYNDHLSVSAYETNPPWPIYFDNH